MNAPATAGALAQPTLEHIPVDKLRPSPTHIQQLRRARFDMKALEELADSIRKVGLLQPLVAKPFKKSPVLNAVPSDPTHIIVAGERRWLAAKAAGLQTVPVNVRELIDEEVLEVQLIENLQREGLHELEEAEGYDELMKLKEINADAVADMVGKSRSYVFARTKLLALCPEARKAFYAGEIDSSKALLVARIGHHDTQRQALKDITQDRRWGGGSMSYREAREHVLEKYMLKLKEAPFAIDDGSLLPKAGTCAACPKRTGNQRQLFADVKDADVCTDPKCFAAKKEAHQQRIRDQLAAKGQTVIAGPEARKILPRHGYGELVGGWVKLDEEQPLGNGRWAKPSKLLGKDFTKTAIVEDPESGKLIPVAKKADLEAALKKQGVKFGPSFSSGGNADAKRRERKARIETAARMRILAAIRDKNRTRDFTLEDTRLVASAMFDRLHFDGSKRLVDALMAEAGMEKPKGHDYVHQYAKSVKDLDSRQLAMLMIDCALVTGCHVASYYNGDAGSLHAIAKRLGIDYERIREQVRDEFGEKATKKGGKK